MNRLLSFKLNGYNLAVPTEQIDRIMINKHPQRSEFILSTGVEVKNLSEYIPLTGKRGGVYENIIFIKDQKDYYGFSVEKVLGYLSLNKKIIPKKQMKSIQYYIRYNEELIPVLNLKEITNGEIKLTEQDIEEIKDFTKGKEHFEEETGVEAGEVYEVSKEEVYKTIEEEINKQKKSITTEVTIQSEKRGFVLPLIVNAAIIMLIVAGILYYVLVENRSAFTVNKAGKVGGVEEEVIKEIKRRSQEEVEAQKRKLKEAKKRLTSIQKEKDYFLQNQQKILSEKEKELRGDYEKKLAEARKKIEASGVKDVESEYQKEKQKLYEEFIKSRGDVQQQMEEERKKFEAELKKKEANLKQEVGKYNKQISEMEQRLVEQKQKLAQAKKKEQNIEAEQQAYMTFRRQLNTFYNKALTDFYSKKYGDGIKVLNGMLPIIDKASKGGIGDEEELSVEKKLVNSLINMAQSEKSKIDFKKMVKSTYNVAQILGKSGRYEEAMMKYFTVYTLTTDSTLKRVSLMKAKNLMEDIYNKLTLKNKQELERNSKILLQDAIHLKNVGDYDSALENLQQVVSMFAGIDITKQALNEIEDINKREQNIIETKRLKEINSRAKAVFKKAEQAYSEGFISEAFVGYEEILKDYRESDYVDIALKGIKKINEEIKSIKVTKKINLVGKFENSGIVVQLITNTVLLTSLGVDDGVEKGDILKVVRKEGSNIIFIGNLKVVEVFTNTSRGRIMYYEKLPAIGDLVLF